MKSLNILITMIIVVLLCTEATMAASFFEKLFGDISGLSGYHQRSFGTTRTPVARYPAARTQKPKGRSYKDICRAVNPAPFAFPNKLPYPSVPIC